MTIIRIVEKVIPYVFIVFIIYALFMLVKGWGVITEQQYRGNKRVIYEIQSSEIKLAYYERRGGFKNNLPVFIYEDNRGRLLSLRKMPKQLSSYINTKEIRNKIIFVQGENERFPDGRVFNDIPIQIKSIKGVVQTRRPLDVLEGEMRNPKSFFSELYSIDTSLPVAIEFKEIIFIRGNKEIKYQSNSKDCDICYSKDIHIVN